MAKVYSYIRFSSKKQEQGDSVRRQTATGEAWLKRHPQHTLDTTLRLNDLGKSAFRGANLDKEKGDLGKFIALAEKGEIPRGSILMLEGWDRFSRMPPFKAARVFGDLVEAGVSVLTLSPEQLIDHTNIDNMEVVLPVVIGMQLAHEESRKKSQRIAEVWKARRQRATEDGEPMTKRCPAWLYWDEEAKKWKVKDGAKKTLLYIFNRTCEGIGQKRLVGELQAKFKPLGDKAKRWNGSMVAGILSRRLVLGEMTPCRRNSKPQPAIVGYYPQVIPEDLFYRAAGGIGRKGDGKGAKREVREPACGACADARRTPRTRPDLPLDIRNGAARRTATGFRRASEQGEGVMPVGGGLLQGGAVRIGDALPTAPARPFPHEGQDRHGHQGEGTGTAGRGTAA